MATEKEKSAKYSPGEDRKLDRFLREILTARDTPDLIRVLAGDGEFLSLCKTLVGIVPEKEPALWSGFRAACRKRGTDPLKIRERLIPAARSLGIGRGENQVDYYALLGVDPSTPFGEIQRTFHKKAKALHPDAQVGGEGDGEAFIRINEAYSVLKDPVLRRHYDESRRSMDAWCEFPNCSYDEPKRTVRNPARIRNAMQIGGVVVLLVILTLVFSVLYENRSLQDGFSNTYSRAPSPREKPFVAAAPSPEDKAPVVEEKKQVDLLQTSPGIKEGKSGLLPNITDKSTHPVKEKTERKASMPIKQENLAEEEPVQKETEGKIEKRKELEPESAPEPAASSTVPKTVEEAEVETASGKSNFQELGEVQKFADEFEEIDRIKAFIHSYCSTYERRDPAAFSGYFSEDAVENDKAFEACAPNYRKIFAAVDKLEYAVNLYRFSHLIDSEIVRVEGTYRITWQVRGGTRQTGTGNIVFDLVRQDGTYRIKKLRYSKIKGGDK